MTRPSTPPILSELRNASSPASQIKALRDLKNEIIGHEEKKEQWVELGVVTPLARILNSYKGNGKKKYRDTNGTSSTSKSRVARTEEEDARLQAIIIVGSLACGGPAFLTPLYAGLVVSPLLSLLVLGESHPQVVTQALKTLNTIADSSSFSAPRQGNHDAGLSNLLYTQQHLSSVSSLLLQAPASFIVQQQLDLTVALICKTCSTEHHRVMLAQFGVLDALAVNLAPLIIKSCPGPGYDHKQNPSDAAPQHGRPRLSLLLKAIGLVIKGSRSRATQLMAAPALASAFATIEESMEVHDSTPRGVGQYGTQNGHQTVLRAFESLLPQLPNSYIRGTSNIHSSSNTASGTGVYNRSGQSSQSLSTAIEVIQSQGLEYVGDEGNPLVTWLLYIFRSQEQSTSLAATEILVILNRLGMIKRPKESLFAFLLVPPLVHMLEKDSKAFKEMPFYSNNAISVAENTFSREEAPAVLATLISNNLETQKAAADAGAIKKLSRLLKESFDPLPINSPSSLWTPETTSIKQRDTDDSSSRLGDPGISPASYHILRLRESVLAALAAIASDKDDYRKDIIDNGVIPFVIKALKAEPIDFAASSSSKRSDQPSDSRLDVPWNYRDTILSACGLARALSRSVSTLRTSLMDAGLAPPLFALLKCNDIEVQVAATAVVCNLVLKFSPMREAIMEGGILAILCEHAHSTNSKLRLNSMWALKHIIAGASNSVKIACLNQLDPGWLKQILTVEVDPPSPATGHRVGAREEGGTTPIRMSTPNAAGEQVDLLNAVVEASRHPNADLEDDGDEDIKMSDSIGLLGSKDDTDAKSLSRQAFHSAEGPEANSSEGIASHGSQRGLSDELAIQKEGLEIIRNLICGDHSPDMIDHLFHEMGQDKVFDLLSAKLRPRVLNAFGRDRRGPENGIRQIQPQTEIIVSVCYTIVHIAAGSPRHRQILVNQTDLMKLLIPLFNHPSRDVRRCCAWFIINLTWAEDSTDRIHARTRARELTKLGFLEKLEIMDKDESLDCRERAKSAREQIRSLLHSS